MAEQRHLLLTGATGLVGFDFLLCALQSSPPYHTTVVIRRASDEAKLLSKPVLAPYHDLLTFAVVPDFSVPGAFDRHLTPPPPPSSSSSSPNPPGPVTHILHAAAAMPQPASDLHATIVAPTRDAARAILQAAARAGSVRSVVLTSSIAVNMVYPPSRGERFLPTDRIAMPEGPFAGPDFAYQAGKIAALLETDGFCDAKGKVDGGQGEGVRFGVASVFPGYIYGRDEAATSVKELDRGSNALVLRLARGGDAGMPLLAGSVLLRDLSKVHLAALEGGEKEENWVSRRGNRCYGASTPVLHSQLKDIVTWSFPEALEEGVLGKTDQQTVGEVYEDPEGEKELGVKLQGWEVMVKEVVEQYLELLEKEKEEKEKEEAQ